MGSAMNAPLDTIRHNTTWHNKTWLGIGIVTVAMLLASSAATSPVVSSPEKRQASRQAMVTALDLRLRPRPCKPADCWVEAPHYYGRPVHYRPSYPPGPVVLFTPFLH
ncbi:putative exported protein of unknown function [Bradyrhizobium sp. BTAi1]|nr:putative exported protein of unknown function [Bradyrhizobium sp. BTAi1]